MLLDEIFALGQGYCDFLLLGCRFGLEYALGCLKELSFSRWHFFARRVERSRYLQFDRFLFLDSSWWSSVLNGANFLPI